ncbi:terminase large subunit domain-containing protein [Neopusillimonas aromaticivorans]|uniref:terminase large subunit domain-containing protein n=1 Tax=Neopusillimonas aromaticivorans TaxID=2979868 RepID=UPI00259640D9|nr:terminase large subunit [Neopusillimonas aromaticivorans]WJJ94008.1 terminase large subunit [Neopusillimonas aromaticivorans]
MAEIEWSTACPDWERRILAGESLIPCPPLFPAEAQEALELFGSLRIVDAAGSPTMAEAARPWVMEFVGAIFGAYNPDTGRRLINEFLLLISKKNGKSTIAAGIMLTALILNWRKSGEFIILAPTKEVADNSFKPIRDMIEEDEQLRALLLVQEHIRTVTHYETNATLKVVAADSDTVSGKKAIGVFIDELHEFGKKAKASNMLLEATGGLTSRPEGFVIYATTQSEQPPAGVFRQKLEYARKVRDGEIENKRFLPVLYEFPAEMVEKKAYRDLQNAYVTNPNWGLSVDIERIEQLHAEYMAGGADKYLEFAAKHLNVEIGMNLRNDRWIGADHWQLRADPGLSLATLLDRCDVVVAGVDGGGLDDLLGLAVIGREKETGRWLHWGRAWAHPSVMERRKEIAPSAERLRP